MGYRHHRREMKSLQFLFALVALALTTVSNASRSSRQVLTASMAMFPYKGSSMRKTNKHHRMNHGMQSRSHVTVGVADCPRQVVLRYLNALTSGDLSAIDTYISEDYIQHSPSIADGKEGLKEFFTNFVATLPDSGESGIEVKTGHCVALGDIVMQHSLFGISPSAQVVVDIFRVQNGLIVEHWDVIQEYVPRNETVSGNDMFTEVPYDILVAQGC